MEEQPALQWKSLKWRDGTEYEGLVNNGRMHSHGVLKFPSKDRYEGQFEDGLMDGYGVYVWADGTVYRGSWTRGRMHGCGVKIWRGAGGGIEALEGKFLGDEFVGPVMCSKDDCLDSAVEADMASFQARSFQLGRLGSHRPVGGVGAGAGGPSGTQGQKEQRAASSTAQKQQQQEQQQQPALSPEAQAKVSRILGRLSADAAKAADAQDRAMSRRQ